MDIKYNAYNEPEQSLVYLLNVDEKIICCLNGVRPDTFSLNPRLINTYDLKFTIDETVYNQGKVYQSAGYDIVGNNMLLYVTGVGLFVMEEPTVLNDGFNETKEIHAESIDSELVNHDLFGFKVNCGTTDSYEMLVDDNVEIDETGVEHAISQIKFYDKDNPELSLLHIALTASETYGWTIGYVDDIPKVYRTFENGVEETYSVLLKDEIGYFDIPSQSVYAFYTQDIATFFEVAIIFDIKNKVINAYRVENLGKDTSVTIGFRNLENDNSIEVDESSIYTRYRVSGGEGLGIEYVNFGSNVIENIEHYLNTKYISEELLIKYKLWHSDMEAQRIEYARLSRLYNTQLEVISELKNRLPLDDTSTDWATFPLEDLENKLSDYQAQQLGIETLFTDAEGEVDWNELYGSELATDYIQIVVYIIPNIEIAISNKDATTADDIEEYREVEDWYLYGLDELKAKITMFEGQREVYVKNGYNIPYTDASGHAEDYHNKCYNDYLWLKNQLDPTVTASCAMEYELRKQEVADEEALLEQYSNDRTDVMNSISKVSWVNGVYRFTEEDLITLSRLYVDTDYENVNMFLVQSDNQVTAIDEQLKLLQAAEDDLSAVSQPQYKITTSLDNFMAKYAYKDYIKALELGDFLRVGLKDDYYITLRFIAMTCNPMMNENEITLEFSNMVKSRSKRNDFTQLLDMASNSGKNQIQGGSNGFASNMDGGSVKYILNQILKSTALKTAITNNINQSIGGYIGSSGNVKITEEGLIQAVDVMAENGFFQYLQSAFIAADKIVADSGIFNDLNVLYAKIRQMLVDSSVTETGVIFNLTADNAVIDEAFLKSVIAQYITVMDLKAGNINTNQIHVLSDDGSLSIIGNTQQFKDSNGNVRIQIGQDSEGNFTFILYDETGNGVIMDESGIKPSAIEDGLIVNEMIADNTIGKEKVNWEDAGAEIDEDGNVIWRGASVTVDGEGIDVKFASILSTIDGLSTSMSGIQVLIDAINNSITNKVWQTDINDAVDGLSTTINDKFSQVEQTVDGITTTVQNLETSLSDDIDGLQTQVTQAVQDATGFKQTVEDTYATKTSLSSVQSTLEQRADSIEQSVSDLDGNVTTLTTDLTGITGRVSDNEDDIANLKLTSDGLALDISNAQGDITALEATATGLATSITNIEGDMTTITTTVDGQETRITTNEGDIANLKLTADGLTASFEDVDDRMTNIEITSDGLKSEVQATVDAMSNLKATNLLLNSTWRLGQGDWIFPSPVRNIDFLEIPEAMEVENAAYYIDIIKPMEDKPNSPILTMFFSDVLNMDVTSTNHSIVAKQGDLFWVSLDVRVRNYNSDSTIFKIVNYSTRTGDTVLDSTSFQKSDFGITDDTDGFVRMAFEYEATQNGFLDVTLCNSDITGIEIVDFREIMFSKELHSQWSPAPQDATGVVVSGIEPSRSKLWCDISVEPPQLKRWNGLKWVIVSDNAQQIVEMETMFNTLIEQKADSIIMQVQSETYLKDDITELLRAAEETIFNQTSREFNFVFNNIKEVSGNITTDINARFEETQKYIRFIDGVIYIGVEGNPIQLKLANDKISFLEGIVEVAWITDDTLMITNARIDNELRIGRFTISETTGKHLAFRLAGTT